MDEVRQEVLRRDPDGLKTLAALTDDERALQIRVSQRMKLTLILGVCRNEPIIDQESVPYMPRRIRNFLSLRSTNSISDRLLDLIHVLERVRTAADVFQPEGTAEAEVHAELRALRSLKGDVAQVSKGHRQTVTKRRLLGSRKKALPAVASYFENNAAYLPYHEYLALGFPIASGPVEGACKNLIKDRMERSGMRWTPSMAEAIVKLRAVYLSGDFDLY